MDDWAKRKGRNYGTALVDLEEHRVIDLLPDREAETLAGWLKENPGTEIISRDRSERYAIGGRQGAPEAAHVADRWHLLRNWREPLQRLFDRYRGRLKKVILPSAKPADEPAAAVLPAKNVNRKRKYEKERKARAQAERQERYEIIRERHAKGEYLTTICRDLGINYKTARKYALSDECPNPNSRRKPQRMLEPYEPYIRARWEEGCKNGKQLHREIAAHGFPGTRTLVARFVAEVRRKENEGKARSPAAAGEPLTPRKASMLLLQKPDRRSEAEATALFDLPNVHQEIAIAVAFTKRFVEIVRDRQGGKLGQWLCDAEASGVHEIQEFVRKARQDEDAVRAGCTLPVSNGQTEGKITKLKAIKRQMYGRAKFDLLRQRALYAA